MELVKKSTIEYLFAQEFVLSYIILIHDETFGTLKNVLEKIKLKGKKSKLCDVVIPRSAYFYLNNTIDLRDGKEMINAIERQKSKSETQVIER